LLNNLRRFPLPAEDIRKALRGLSLPDDVRAERLTIAQFVQLYDLLTSL
jgi:16S rRNA A1518/A1519 N6-dimethyltransferase RsmA/KsgA/DIM1 with predicted DNA glycosylase/AP lyase activity